MDVSSLADKNGRKYCQAEVSDEYGSIDVQVCGSLVDMIKEDQYVTLENVVFR